MAHIPWWHYATLHERPPIPIDVVVIDHAACEILNDAIRYIMRLSRIMLKNTDPALFIIGALGSKKVNSIKSLFHEFDLAGYDAVFKRTLYGLTPKGSSLAPLAMTPAEVAARNLWTRIRVRIRRGTQRRMKRFLALDDRIPRYNPSGRAGTVMARDVIPLVSTEAPLDYSFLDAAGFTVPPATK